MTVFISYARANQAAAEQLRADVERCHRQAWVDRELTGGQSWWRTILDHIRRCDVFVVALSPQWIHSKACDLELRYALALGRPVLPVMVAKVDPRLAPPAVADAQIVGYLQRSAEVTFALRDALDTLPAAPPLPSPPPPEPAAPISYLHNIILMLNAPVLEPRDQFALWHQLRGVLDETEPEDQAELVDLARRFRRRADLVPQVRHEVDDLLGPPTSPGSRTVPPVDAPVWSAPTQMHSRVLPAPAPQTSPLPRSHRVLLWASAPAAVILVASSVYLAVAAGDHEGDPAGPSTTTTSQPTTSSSAGGGHGGGGGGNAPEAHTPTGPELITMPELTGMSADGATGALRAAGWSGSLSSSDSNVTTDDPAQDGAIVSQNPSAGARVRTDVAVAVTVLVYASIVTENRGTPVTTETAIG
jgi:hypothetical protein